MKGIENAKKELPILKNDKRIYLYLQGSYFQQNNVLTSNNHHVINNIIASTRDDTFTVQNALFGAMQITKNSDTSKYAYKGYDICFDEGGMFSEGSINKGRNVLIFGVHGNSVMHSSNKANNIYVMGKDFVQGINDTTLCAEKVYSQNFTQPSKKFILSLRYNRNDSYLFVNCKQELKFKCKIMYLNYV